jgi:hypothetical protein
MFAVKVIKKEELPVGTSSLFLAARDSHQTKPNDIYKKDYLSIETIVTDYSAFRLRHKDILYFLFCIFLRGI